MNSDDTESRGGALGKLGKFIYTFRGYLPAPALAAVIIYAAPTGLSFLAGLALALLGQAMRLWALTYIGPKSRAEGKRRADRLITEGPYSLTRNPLYVANLTIAAGILLAANRWILLAAIPLGVFYYLLVAYSEEEFLASAFPGQWEAFRKTVPRFFPRIAKMARAEVRFAVSAVFTPELSTIIAWETGMLLVGSRMFWPVLTFGGDALRVFNL